MSKNMIFTLIFFALILIFISLNFNGKNGERAIQPPVQQICFPIYDRCALQCMLDRSSEDPGKYYNTNESPK